jgi:hypothetical protein
VVGLYLDPPEHAVVLSIDEKSQIQALDSVPCSSLGSVDRPAWHRWIVIDDL